MPNLKPRHHPYHEPTIIPILIGAFFLSGRGMGFPAGGARARIKAVENGLQSAYILKSDHKTAPRWTIRERMAFHKVPGLSVAVIHKGRIAWTKAYGLAEAGSARPLNDDTIFQTASMGKTVTAAAVLALVERGRLDLDADISSSLKSWRIPESEWTRETPVTLAALLSHTAGFRKGRSGEFEYDFALPTLLQVLNGESPSPHPPVTVTARPGTVWQYSNVGYYIVQQVLEDACGKPFPEIVGEMVLKPVGMTRSFYRQRLTPEEEKNAAFGHDQNGTLIKGRYRIYPAFGSGSGFWSTPDDLARLAIELNKAFSGAPNSLFSKTTAMRMAKPVLGTYGLGLFIQPDDRRSAFHSGDTNGYHNILRIHLSEGWGCVIMTNGENGTRLYDELQRALAEEYVWPSGRMRIMKPSAVKEEDLRALEGRYSDDLFPPLNVMVMNDRLVSDHFAAPGAELLAESPRRFFSAVQGVGYEFIQDSAGRTVQAIVTYLGNGRICRRLGKPRRPIIPVLLPIIEKNGIRAGLDALDRLKGENPDEHDWGEPEVNALGYELMNRGRLPEAVAVFELNVKLHPASANVYDSLAEAYEKAGKRELAVANYEKSLQLNPQNQNAVEQLRKLRKISSS